MRDSFLDETLPRVVAAGTGHGVSKSHTAAGLVLWAMSVFPYITCLTTAPTWRQVEKILWRYIAAQHRMAKVGMDGEVRKTQWEVGKNRLALGVSTNEPTRFQGFHQRRMLVVVDEASGVEEPIWDAIEGVVTGPLDVVFAIGNPTEPDCQFAKYLLRKKRATVLNISSWEAAEARDQDPERFGGLVSRQWCEARRIEWGEDSAAYESRVMGRVPKEGADVLIRYAWVERAMQREPESTKLDRVVCGIDVARYGSDKTVWIIKRGDDVVAWESLDKGSIPMQLELTKKYADEYRINHFVIDDTGIGGALVDFLAVQGYSVTGINFGETAEDEGEYVNRRTELWWNMREWFRLNRGACVELDELRGDCVSPKYFFEKKDQRKRLESKDDIKKRRGTSPDFGDALALALWDSSAGAPFSVPDSEEAIDFWDHSWGKSHGPGNEDV